MRGTPSSRSSTPTTAIVRSCYFSTRTRARTFAWIGRRRSRRRSRASGLDRWRSTRSSTRKRPRCDSTGATTRRSRSRTPSSSRSESSSVPRRRPLRRSRSCLLG
jgi:hypothetical protein